MRLVLLLSLQVVCDTAKVRFFKQITTFLGIQAVCSRCLRYCKSTIFQANHNRKCLKTLLQLVVCDTAKVRFFKQITTRYCRNCGGRWLFAILQKYDFSSKSQLFVIFVFFMLCCLRYCKSTIFQANHNRFVYVKPAVQLFAILQKYDFSSKSQLADAPNIVA